MYSAGNISGAIIYRGDLEEKGYYLRIDSDIDHPGDGYTDISTPPTTCLSSN